MERGGYDAAADAERLSAPMRRWAQLGFLRGFAGVRSEVLPKGRMNLPSAAFREAASRESLEGLPEDEADRRGEYIEAVEARLREIQAESVASHFHKAAWGQVADFGVGMLFVVLGIGLLVRVGPYHPVTFVFLALFGAKLVFMHYAVRRMVRLAQEAFRSESGHVTFPWSTSG